MAGEEGGAEKAGPVLTQEQRHLLAQQIRQHTQLLTQTALLSTRDETWTTVHQHAREMLSDLVQVRLSYSIQPNWLSKNT